MSFDLKDAAPESKQSQYQRPGIYDNIKVTEVTLGAASTGSKYIQFATIGADGSVGKSPQMYLNGAGEPVNPEKPTAWSITARNLKTYLASTHNVTLEEAAGMISGVASPEQLQTKVPALLVGKLFRGKFSGVQTSKGAIIAELSGSESMRVPSDETKLKYDAVRDTKLYKGTPQTGVEAVMQPTSGNDDLPF